MHHLYVRTAPLLQQLQLSGLGLRFYAGGFLHADDIRTLASSEDSLKRQVAIVKEFAAAQVKSQQV